MGPLTYRKKTAAVEIQLLRNYDMAGGNFDGTDKPNIPATMFAADGANWWAEGFYIYPATTGDVEVITYTDWVQNNKVIDDSFAQVLPGLAGGIFHAIRVVKILAANTTVANVVIGV